MTDAYLTTVERLRQFREARTSAATSRLGEAQQTDAAARGTLPAGTRVLDRATGQEGEVVDFRLPSSVGARRVAVRLLSGQVIDRDPSELLARPTPPTG